MSESAERVLRALDEALVSQHDLDLARLRGERDAAQLREQAAIKRAERAEAQLERAIGQVVHLTCIVDQLGGTELGFLQPGQISG